ncbi:hypothetical protein FRX31_026273 [Thalictrum thalictroides]|uniref:Uncharacterized protein n=1 Tax=Thalictrum thalictroides TaxID=46969 RepID=A0A7J6VGB2_THATH|nr:hypothetical protein FRX31_026273 [Thalictrum thalictroides]
MENYKNTKQYHFTYGTAFIGRIRRGFVPQTPASDIGGGFGGGRGSNPPTAPDQGQHVGQTALHIYIQQI